MKRLSLHNSTVFSVTLIGLLFILLSSLAGNYFREAALDAQTKSLSRIIEVASNEVLRKLQRHAINLSSSINTNNNLSRALHSTQKSGDNSTVIEILNDPFITGFVGAPDVELMKIRIYDLALQPLFQSSRGQTDLAFQMPPHLHTIAAQRSGVERLKALSGLWVSATSGPRYSVLLPIGGLRIDGYIEIVFSPRFTLQAVSEMTRMPVTILLPGEPYTPASQHSEKSAVLPIEYTLYSDDGQAAYRMIGMEDIDKLNQDMLQTQWLTVIGFLTIIFCVLLLVLWLLRIGLFTPLRNLLQGIEEYGRGNLDTTIKPGGLHELYTLGNTFNQMLQRIRDDIRELERHSTIDGLTGLSNRRYFENCLEHEWHRAIRIQSEMSLLFIDIDYFKKYNDHYGHLGGDDCLRQVANAIGKMAKRTTDVTARYGGEEFVVLLPDTDQERAEQLASALKQVVAECQLEHVASEVSDILTLSIGVATMRPHPQQPQTLLIEAADKALYRAKDEGRDRIAVAPPRAAA